MTSPREAADGSLLPPDWRPGAQSAPPPAGPLLPPRFRPPNPRAVPGRFRLRDGTAFVLRPLRAEDRDLVIAGFERLSERSRYRRFLSPTPRLTTSLLDFLMNVDDENHYAIMAVTDDPENPAVIGVSRYVRLADPQAAEAATTVIDQYQGLGAGTFLHDALVLAARARGITRFEGLVLEENRASRAILAHAGARLEPDAGGVLRYILELPADAEELQSSPVRNVLRSFAAKLHRKGDPDLPQVP